MHFYLVMVLSIKIQNVDCVAHTLWANLKSKKRLKYCNENDETCSNGRQLAFLSFLHLHNFGRRIIYHEDSRED